MQAKVSIFEFVETWYNRNRIHATIKSSIKKTLDQKTKNRN